MEISEDGGEYVDWKGRRAVEGKHGGRTAAALVCAVEVLENLAFVAPAASMVSYFSAHMHYPAARAANMLTNYMGAAFLLTMFGGFVSDSFVSRFWTVVGFGSSEVLGLALMAIQASTPSLQPPAGKGPSPPQAAVLLVGLYAMALGVGGVKASLPAHGADQLDHRSSNRQVAGFFNWFFFSLCAGGLLAVTVLAWVQESRGWQWGFGLCAASLLLGLCAFGSGFRLYRHKVPTGSPFTRILQVFVGAARNSKVAVDDPKSPTHHPDAKRIAKFRFLEKAAQGGRVSSSRVEEAKIFLRLLPIFASTIMMNCCLAQLQTFSVHQGITMDRRIKGFEIPVASLTTIPLTVMLVSVPFYDRVSSWMSRRAGGGSATAIKPLHRIGVGLALASCSMAAAAAVEVKRRGAAAEGERLTVLWLGWQYLLLGVSDMFTLAGMLEFFYSEAPEGMRSLCTSLSWCSTAMGYFLSSVLVGAVNSAGGWLASRDMDENRLELFYALLCVLNFVNFLNYLFWAKWY